MKSNKRNEDNPSKYFLETEQNIQNGKVIKEIRKKNGEITKKHQEKMEEFKYFYKDLYSENIMPDRFEQNYYLSFTKKINEEEERNMEKIVRTQEMQEVIKDLKKEKTPEPDGISYEFYEHFKKELCIILEAEYM